MVVLFLFYYSQQLPLWCCLDSQNIEVLQWFFCWFRWALVALLCSRTMLSIRVYIRSSSMSIFQQHWASSHNRNLRFARCDSSMTSWIMTLILYLLLKPFFDFLSTILPNRFSSSENLMATRARNDALPWWDCMETPCRKTMSLGYGHSTTFVTSWVSL